jgi:hypothetical protein
MSDLSLEDYNQETATTILSARSQADGSFNGGVVLQLEADTLSGRAINGVVGIGQGATSVGVVGLSETGVLGEGNRIGVIGRLSQKISSLPPTFDNVGVLGTSFGDKLSAGVIGESDIGYAFYGTAGRGIAVRGDIESGIGVFGLSVDDTGVRGDGIKIGVHGASDQGIGVLGDDGFGGEADEAGIGVQGISSQGTGVKGTAQSGIGVLASSDSGVALGALGGSKGVPAGVFVGGVVVFGNQVVTGTKSAALAQADGSHRLLYCMESPESWFEDFGEAKLSKGKAKVTLAADFAGSVKTNQYHVFLTAYGDSNGLFIAQRTAKGFEVREQNGGRSTIRFSYRIVAHRKDVDPKRMAKIRLPHLQKLASPVAMPRPRKLPDPPRRSKVAHPVVSKARHRTTAVS